MTEFKTVMKVSNISEGQIKEITINGKVIIIMQSGGSYYALEGICSHEHNPLAGGFVEGKVLTCPWHGAQFDIRTGKVLALPATTHLTTYEIKVDEGEIKVKI